VHSGAIALNTDHAVSREVQSAAVRRLIVLDKAPQRGMAGVGLTEDAE
jgi:hypothetical protein